MMTFQKLKIPKDGSVQGIVNYLKQTAEYYAQGMNLPAYWQGKGIEDSGLKATDRDANLDFAKLLAGMDPLTNMQIQTRSKNSNLAYDLTMNCPKGFSIAIASCKDEPLRQEMIDAVREANDHAIAYVMDGLECRTGSQGKGKKVSPERTFMRSVMHLDSRDGEAQAHIHNVLVNTAIDANGKARCFEDRLHEVKALAGELFDARLARNFQALVLGVNRDIETNEYGEETGKVFYHISGIDRDTEMAFSGRRKAILDAKAEAKKQGIEITGTQANLRTRKGKDNESTPQEIIHHTQDRVRELHQQHKLDWSDSQELVGRVGTVQTQTMAEILAGMHENNSFFSREQLTEQVAKKCALDLDAVEFTDAFLAEAKGIIPLKQKGLYCTTEQWEIEQGCVLSAIARQGDPRHNLDPDAVERAIRAQEEDLGFSLAKDQAEAVRHVCLRSGGFSIIEGKAGTGKTASAGAYVKAHQEAGYTVWGASTSQVATDNLANEVNASTPPNGQKMEAFNTAKLLLELDSGRLRLTDKHLLVLDEAGMVGAKTMHRLQEHSDKAGAKIIAVGDSKQLQPIQAGNPFYAMGDVIGKTEIAEIRRQKNQTHLDMANAFYDQNRDGHALIGEMRQKGMIVEGTNKQDAIGKLATAYLKDENPYTEKLILAATHKDGDALTERLRKELDQTGALGMREKIMTARTDQRALKVEEKEIAVNDRIRFTRNQKNLDLRNNDLATVVGFGKEKNNRFMHVRMDADPQTVRKIPLREEANHFVHGYVRITHSAQGLGEKNVYALATEARTANRNMVMVNFTRTKEQFRYYGTEREFGGMADRIANFENKESVQDLLPEHLRVVAEQTYKKAQATQRQQVALQFPSLRAERQMDWNQRIRAYDAVVNEQGQRVNAREQAEDDCKALIKLKTRCDADIANLDKQKKGLGLFGNSSKKKAIEASKAEKLKERQGAELAHVDAWKEKKRLDSEIERNSKIALTAQESARKLRLDSSAIQTDEYRQKWINRHYQGGREQEKKDRRVVSSSPSQRLSQAIGVRQERKAEQERIRQHLQNAQKQADAEREQQKAQAQASTHERQRTRGLSHGL